MWKFASELFCAVSLRLVHKGLYARVSEEEPKSTLRCGGMVHVVVGVKGA